MGETGCVVIAIDGPSGAGKSTVARLLARRLGYLFLDTGAMYRAVTLAVMRERIPLEDSSVARFLPRLRMRFSDDGQQIYIAIGDRNEADVSDAIRTPEVTANVSIVSASRSVRELLTEEQRRIATGRSVVAEGRDTTTVVFPAASQKFFLTASLEARAARRRAERLELANMPLPEVAKEISSRDALDSHRILAPLTRAEGAVVVDTTQMALDDVVEALLARCRK